MIQTLEQKNRKIIIILISVVTGMFAFATLLLPPLYDAFCNLTGLNGKVDLTAAEAPTTNQSTNTQSGVAMPHIDVILTTKTDKAIPWIFKPLNNGIRVTPGQSSHVEFSVTNPTKTGMSGRAIPSVSPAQATAYLRKIECFCFQEQYLAAGETKIMPLQFYFTDEIPDDIREVTLSYTLYEMEKEDGSSSN